VGQELLNRSNIIILLEYVWVKKILQQNNRLRGGKSNDKDYKMMGALSGL